MGCDGDFTVLTFKVAFWVCCLSEWNKAFSLHFPQQQEHLQTLQRVFSFRLKNVSTGHQRQSEVSTVVRLNNTAFTEQQVTVRDSPVRYFHQHMAAYGCCRGSRLHVCRSKSGRGLIWSDTRQCGRSQELVGKLNSWWQPRDNSSARQTGRDVLTNLNG